VSAALVTQAPLAHFTCGPDDGTAPIAVLLHGVGGGREGWHSTGAALAAAGWRVLAADQPGYGLSARIEPYDLAGMARAVQSLIVWAHQESSVPSTAVSNPGAAVRANVPSALVVGHSMGGMVAQELHATAPECVRGLVLAATSSAFGSPDGAWQQQFLQSRFAPLDSGAGMAGLAAQLVPTMLGSAATPQANQAAQALMAGVPEATYRAAVLALLPFDRRAALPGIQVPTLVITGEDDRTAPADVARRMAARIGGAELVILPGTGHLLMLEQPQAFDAAVLEFVKRRFPEIRS
jgi:3-oxoadipate enol-lactonase